MAENVRERRETERFCSGLAAADHGGAIRSPKKEGKNIKEVSTRVLFFFKWRMPWKAAGTPVGTEVAHLRGDGASPAQWIPGGGRGGQGTSGRGDPESEMGVGGYSSGTG